MEPVCNREFTDADFAVLEIVRFCFRRFPNGLTCHEVCERVCEELVKAPRIDHDFVHATGKFMGCDHSWLASKVRPVILDPYPWACGSGPMLLTLEGYLNPWRKVYNPLPDCLIRENNPV